jgi:hypothetical protein
MEAPPPYFFLAFSSLISFQATLSSSIFSVKTPHQIERQCGRTKEPEREEEQKKGEREKEKGRAEPRHQAPANTERKGRTPAPL